MVRGRLDRAPLGHDKADLIGVWVIDAQGRTGRLLSYVGWTVGAPHYNHHWDVRWQDGRLGVAIPASTLELLHPLEVLARETGAALFPLSRVNNENTTGGAR